MKNYQLKMRDIETSKVFNKGHLLFELQSEDIC